MRDRRFESRPFATFDADRLWAGQRPSSGIGDAAFVGTRKSDVITGTDRDDTFDLSQGGKDIVSGGRGSDTFYFGAEFTGADQVDGGDTGRRAQDVVTLDGDYSRGIHLESTSLVQVEQLILEGGSYDIRGFFSSDFTHRLRSLDASGLDDGQILHMRVTGNLCDTNITGSGGDDIIDTSALYFRAEIAGGEGDDLLKSSGGGWLYGEGGDDRLDGRGDLSSADLYGGVGDDVLIGGSYTYYNELNGGAGADTIAAQSDYAEISYYTTSDSNSAAYDTITKFDGWLVFAFDMDTTKAGVQHDFHLGETPGRTGDVVVHYDAGLNHTIVDAFTDGDTIADFSVHLLGNVTLTLDDFKTDVF